MRIGTEREAVVVGAGIAGLVCARELQRAGVRTVVLEKSRGVGGRCATRRMEGQPVDHGLAFIHGADPDFVAETRGLPGALPGWPRRVEGSGPPCQPGAFVTGQERCAYAAGMTAFPKHLAEGIEVRLDTRVRAILSEAGAVRVESDAGGVWITPLLVLALPPAQASAILRGLGDQGREAKAIAALLEMSTAAPCLTVMALYDAGAPAPDWDLLYPGDSDCLQLVSHDSAKRPGAPALALIAQARPLWSRSHLDESPETWSALLLDELARLLGPWARRPRHADTQRWRHARLESFASLTHPVVLELSGGARVGLAGELFGYQGGAEAAWISGRDLARRLAGAS